MLQLPLWILLVLVKGASKGEGLGNKFLSHVREVDTIIHLTNDVLTLKKYKM